jgi:hypothetical protein
VLDGLQNRKLTSIITLFYALLLVALMVAHGLNQLNH